MSDKRVQKLICRLESRILLGELRWMDTYIRLIESESMQMRAQKFLKNAIQSGRGDRQLMHYLFLIQKSDS